MNAFLPLDSFDVWHVAGWTMLHFLWLGTIAGLAAGVCRLVLRRAGANTRYAAAVVCLAILAMLPVGICVWVGANPQAMRMSENLVIVSSPETAPPAPGSAGGLTDVTSAQMPAQVATTISREPAIVTDATPNPRQSRGFLDVFASAALYLPWIWVIGTPLTFVLLATGVVGAERLRRTSRVIDDGPITDACARLIESLRIGQRVTIAVCERIAAPVLVGIVRPIILLPPAALTGWSPDEIEMVLLHELAHVRRWDNLVNLVQRFVESLLFFHPAVWLVSSWVRREREACCDAVVVGRTNRPHAYAEMLVAFAARLSEQSEPGRPRPRFSPATMSAMAAGPLRGRIRHILGLQDDPMLISGKSLGVVTSGLLLAATLVVLNLPTRGLAEESATNDKVSAEKKTVGAESTTVASRQDPETELVRKEIDDLQRSKRELEDRLTVFQSDFELAKRRLDSQTAPSDQDKKRLELQSITKEAQIQLGVLQHQIAEIDKSLGDRLASLRRSKELSADLKAINNVEFSVGTSRFADGDKITITEVRGTADTFEPGNNYLIRGTYALASRNSAKLMASVTAKNRADGTGAAHSNQSAQLRGGSGTFTLELRMSAPGWPHVSFYPADGGQSIGGIYFGTGDSVLKNWSEVYGSDNSRPADSRTQVERGKFPSLDEQKLADVIWRRMGLEMELLSQDELRRVQTLGYDGGLKITQNDGSVITWETMRGGILPNDILVGLHVWPTTSLKEVVEILNRDDLAELNPLKFYVVHPELDGANPAHDVLITGRFSVSVEKSSGSMPQQTYQNRAVRNVAQNAYEPVPIPPLTEQEKASLRERGPLRLQFYYAPNSEPCRRAEERIAQYETVFGDLLRIERLNVEEQSALAASQQIRVVPTMILRQGDSVKGKINGAFTVSELDAHITRIAREQSLSQQEKPSSQDAGKTRTSPGMSKTTSASTPELRYAGKTFDEWRTIWQTELSLERRLEVVKALAAFGASGRGKEAAQAILDVANQLDWTSVDFSAPSGKLKQGCIDAFTTGNSTEGYRIPVKDWWPLVAPIYENSPEKSTIVTYLSYQLPAGEKELIPKLLELSDKDEATRNLAMMGLKAVDPGLTDERVMALLRRTLQDPKTPQSQLWWAMSHLLSSSGSNSYGGGMGGGGGGGTRPQFQLRMVPELQPLLFHPEQLVRQQARFTISNAQPKDAAALVEQLKQRIDMQDGGRERKEAIRALAALGQRATPAEDSLKAIALNPKDSARIPAAAALLAMWPDSANWGDHEKLNKLFGPGTTDQTDSTDLARKLETEQQEIFGVYTQSTLGGGGGMF